MPEHSGTWSGLDVERESFDLLGFSPAYPLADPDRASSVVATYDFTQQHRHNPHVDNARVVELLQDPMLETVIERLCGPGYLLWRSAFFAKSTGVGEIGWHHDKHFQDGDADVQYDGLHSHISVFFGLTEVTQRNGMLELIPGTHRPVDGLERDVRPFHLRPLTEHILDNLNEQFLRYKRALPVPAGSFVVFHSSILHRSVAHAGGSQRLGLAIRLVKGDKVIPDALADAVTDVRAFPLRSAEAAE
ncbi:MAG: phytanoyl-CoA dioxygenase family protein [Pseudomonadota bacterium]